MAIEIPMPKLGLTMEEATIIEWRVADGDLVEVDSVIMLIETDKTETEVGSVGAGRIHLIGQPGEVFKCGALIGYLLAEGEEPPGSGAVHPADSLSAGPSTGGPAVIAGRSAGTAISGGGAVGHATASNESGGQSYGEPTGRLFVSPNARRVAAELGIHIADVRGTGPAGRIVSEDVRYAATQPRRALQPPATAQGGTFAPPSALSSFRPMLPSANANAVASIAARNLADLLGIDLAQVAVDPIEQRITRDGVALYVRQRLQTLASGAVGGTGATGVAGAAASAPSAVPTQSPAGVGVASGQAGGTSSPSFAPLLQQPTKIIPLRGMRGTIAKRMHASLQEMAQLTLTMEADMSAVLADRDRRKASGSAPSITDYIVAAAARALVRHPGVNAQVTAEGIALLPDVHVGLAVAVDNGLLVPVIRNTPSLSLAELAAETSRVAGAARTGTSSPADLEGGTFSVTALGAFGVDTFTPVINPPNAAILGIGRLRDHLTISPGIDPTLTGDEPRPFGNLVVATKRLTLSLTWDHRVLDGVPAAEFCRTIVELLAAPDQLD